MSGQFCCNLSGWTNTDIEVVAPLSATTGAVEVRIRAFDIDLSTGERTPGFISSGAGPTFTVVPPEVTGLSVAVGPPSTVVHVFGTNFGNGVDTGSGRLVLSPLKPR